MAKVIWSPKSLDQIDGIAEYIANDSPSYAKQVVLRIIEATRRLESFPEIGSVVPELGSTRIREIRVYSYRLLYRIVDSQVVRVVGVVHGKQLLDDGLVE
jgi:addiction module RelE/StbE family toxin